MADTKKRAWTQRHRKNGQYSKGPKCDGCGKPVGDNYYTDYEVCGDK